MRYKKLMGTVQVRYGGYS